MANLKDKICNYLDHIQDGKYIQDIFQEADAKTVVDTVISIVNEENYDTTHEALSFLRDAAINWPSKPEKITNDVRKYIEESPNLINCLADKIISENYWIRSLAIYTIGKLSFEQHAKYLLNAFPIYFKKDPLLLPKLTFEINWLKPETLESLVDKIIASPNYLIRWSALECLEPYTNPPKKLFLKWYKILETDENPYIAEEAKYKIAELEKLKTKEPSITFENISLRFNNSLYQNKKGEYTLNEFDDFVQNILNQK